MERPAGEWNSISGSRIHYRMDKNGLELSCTSGAFISVIATIVITAPLGLLFLSYPIHAPASWIGLLVYELIFLISPSLGFPWLPFKNHLIVDAKENMLEILKKNVGKRIISSKTYSLDDIKDIKIDALPGEAISYKLSLNIKHAGKVSIWTSISLNVVQDIEALLRSRIRQLKTKATEFSVPGLAIPLQSLKHEAPAQPIASKPANRDATLTCAVDHSVTEGFVYICPNCHALLCTACMSVYAARSMGCPRCGHPVPPARQRDESPLLEMADDKDERAE